MTLPAVISATKRLLPAQEWPWVLRALRCNPLVWRCLEGRLGNKLVALASSHPQDYSPAALALLSLDAPTTAEILRNNPEAKLAEAASPASPAAEDDPERRLQQAFLLAMRWRQNLPGGAPWGGAAAHVDAPAAFACLFGILPDPGVMLQGLLAARGDPAPGWSGASLALHSLLANPMPPQAHIALLTDLLTDLPSAQRLPLLAALHAQRPDLTPAAAQAALRLGLRPAQTRAAAAEIRQADQPMHLLIEEASQVWQSARLHFLARQSEEGAALLQSAARSFQRVEAALAAEAACSLESQETGDSRPLWEAAARLDPQRLDYTAGLTLAQIYAGGGSDAQRTLDSLGAAPAHPGLAYAAALLALQNGDRQNASILALQAVEQMQTNPAAADAPDYATGLASLLLDLDNVVPAARLAQRLVETTPASARQYALLAAAQLANQQPAAAAQSAAQAVALSAADRDHARLLAECLEADGNWEAAYPIRSDVVESHPGASIEDRCALALCALQSGQAREAHRLCEQIILEEEDYAAAWVVQGQALAALGDAPAALEDFQHAAQVAPEQAAPWLAQAALQRGMGQPVKALDTLRAAVQIASELPEIHLALGEAYLEGGALTQAVTALRAAHNLAQARGYTQVPGVTGLPPVLRPLGSQARWKLGLALRQLGQNEEASEILTAAYQRQPSDAAIAQEYARVLLALGRPEHALAPLQTVLQSEPADAAPYLDYAAAILSLHEGKYPGVTVSQALPPLERALELEPENTHAVALSAEAQAAAGNYPAALEAYQKALESTLARDPAWLGRLSLGLGEAAVHLGQIDAAVAAMQEADRACPGDSRILRGLSEALEAAGLLADSYIKAQSARQAAPTDADNLAWFASQVISLAQASNGGVPDAQAEAVAALEQAVSLAPDRSDLWLQLGQAQLKGANYSAALQAFTRMAELPAAHAYAQDYYLAAQGLLRAGEALLAIECLQRALQCPPSGREEEPALLDMLTSLAHAQRKAGLPAQALASLEQAIALAPNEADLYLEKADLLLNVTPGGEPGVEHTPGERTRLALSCLDAALKLKPKDTELRLRAAAIHRAAGDLGLAEAHVAQILSMNRLPADQKMRAHTLAAELACAMLQPQQAWKRLESLSPAALNGRPEADTRIHYYSLRASLALNGNQDQDAVESLVEVVELAPDAPGMLAIQARLSLRRGDPKAAAELFSASLKALGDPAAASLPVLYETVETALELGGWEVLDSLGEALLRSAPHEPAAHLLGVRGRVIRAERQRLYPLLDVTRRLPGEQALNQTAFLEFEALLQKAASLAGLENPPAGVAGYSEAQEQIDRWRARGRAAFQPSAAHAQLLGVLPPNAEDSAARVACLRNCGDLTAAGQAAREFSHHPLVLLNLSLALQEEKPRQAMAAIHAAADAFTLEFASSRKGSSAAPASAAGARWAAPLVYIQTARLFHRNGHRASDYTNALQAVQKALDCWPDEPRWHTLAAEICMDGVQSGGADGRQAATVHLEQAISLDPAYLPALLLLGQLYLEEDRLARAVEIFELASQAAPETSEVYLWLARAHRLAGDLDQAALRAERAVALAPNQAEPLLLRGEIALQVNNPRGALSRAQAALRIEPENAAGLLLLAQALSALERDDEALIGLEKALVLLGEPISLSIERVRLIQRIRGQAAALQAAQQLASRYPDDTAVLAQLAALLDANGEEEAAIRAAQRALRDSAHAASLSPGEQVALHHLLGRGLRRAGQLDQAILHLKEAVRMDAQSMDAYLELGRAHLERREHRQALQVFNQAASLAPGDHRPYYEIGLALKESKEYLGAEKMLRRAAELAPNDLAIHRLLAAVVALNLVHNRREPRESKLTQV